MQTTKTQISLLIRAVWSASVIPCLDSIIPLVSICKILSWLVSSAEQASLSLPWLQTLKTDFLVMWLILSTQYKNLRVGIVISASYSCYQLLRQLDHLLSSTWKNKFENTEIAVKLTGQLKRASLHQFKVRFENPVGGGGGGGPGGGPWNIQKAFEPSHEKRGHSIVRFPSNAHAQPLNRARVLALWSFL